MRFYNQQHRFYCGIDLHARSMHVCILNQKGRVVPDKNLPCHFETLLQALAPFRGGLVLGVECMFGWYWLADKISSFEAPSPKPAVSRSVPMAGGCCRFTSALAAASGASCGTRPPARCGALPATAAW
jgi:hypothetical protein